MKRVGHIFDKICTLENITEAIHKAAAKKRKQRRVMLVLNDIDRYASQIQTMLIENTYVPSPYIVKTVFDGVTQKERTIYKPRFYPDQIIHWAIMLQLEPVVMKGMYQYCCGSVPGRGTGLARKALRKWIDKDYRGTKYCAKLDIRKFYPSINNNKLMDLLGRKIKDKRCMDLLGKIVHLVKGLPIGSYISPWLSNFYLQGLDHFIKETLGVKYYIRYVDDLVLLGPNKKKLHRAVRDISGYLQGLGLNVKGDWQVFLINARAIDFLGYRFFRDKTILRKRNSLRIRRRLNKIAKKPLLTYKDACAVVSYWGWLRHSDSYHFYLKHVKPKVSLAAAKRRISYESVRNHCA